MALDYESQEAFQWALDGNTLATTPACLNVEVFEQLARKFPERFPFVKQHSVYQVLLSRNLSRMRGVTRRPSARQAFPRWGFLPKATERPIADLASHDLPSWEPGSLPDHRVDVDRLRPVAKRVTSTHIDVRPSDRENVLEQGCSLHVPSCFLMSQRLDKSIALSSMMQCVIRRAHSPQMCCACSVLHHSAWLSTASVYTCSISLATLITVLLRGVAYCYPLRLSLERVVSQSLPPCAGLSPAAPWVVVTPPTTTDSLPLMDQRAHAPAGP